MAMVLTFMCCTLKGAATIWAMVSLSYDKNELQLNPFVIHICSPVWIYYPLNC